MQTMLLEWFAKKKDRRTDNKKTSVTKGYIGVDSPLTEQFVTYSLLTVKLQMKY